jgi:hypothetical protein
MPLDEARMAVGQLLLGRAGVFYTAIFDLTVPAHAPPEPRIATDAPIALLATTMDARIHHGHWHVFGNVVPNLTRIPQPPHKVDLMINDGVVGHIESFDKSHHRPATPDELAALEPEFSVSPMMLERAFRALHGIEQWLSHYNRLRFDDVKRRASIHL